MAYQQNIPQASDRLKDSQADLLANFQSIKTLIDVNHVTFDATGEGKHKFVSLPEQGAAPTTLANELAVYSAQGAVNSVADLFFRRESDGSQINMTEGGLVTNGWSRIASGIIIKWGANSVTGTSQTITMSQGPAFGSIYSAQLTPRRVAGGVDTLVQMESLSTANINLSVTNLDGSTAQTATINWFAIGA